MSDDRSPNVRTERIQPPGWMVLHCPAVAGEDEPFAEMFQRLGLRQAGHEALAFGGTAIEWVEGDAARAAAELGSRAGHRSIGVDATADSDDGRWVALRASDGSGAPVQATQRLCAAVGMVAAATAATRLYWAPARLWSSVAMFSAAVIASERQGLPPVMHLVGFDVAEDGATSIGSDGLAWFCGHELRLTAPSGYPVAQALRRAARLAVDAMVHRGLVGPMTVTGIERGEELIVGPPSDAHDVPVVPVELRPTPG